MLSKDINSFKYVYPPRAETKSPPSGLSTYERMGFIAQPKLNGSCGVLFLDGLGTARLMGRHNNDFVRISLDKEHLKSLHRGAGYMVLVGEFLNKSKKNSEGKTLEGFVIFDILVLNGRHLINTTFKERQSILDTLYTTTPYDKWISNISPSTYRVNNFTESFDTLFKEIIKVDVYEGFVLKRPSGKLENGLREANNTGWAIKIRKPTKNYCY